MQENEKQRVSSGNFCNFCFQNSYFSPQKWMSLISSSFWMMTMRFFRLKTNMLRTFPLFVYILVNILTILYLLKLKIRAIPSPPSQQQTKKIKSHYKSWMLQDFPSFQAMKHMSLSLSLPIKIRPAPQNNGWMFSEAGVDAAILNMSPSKQWRLKNLTKSWVSFTPK